MILFRKEQENANDLNNASASGCMTHGVNIEPVKTQLVAVVDGITAIQDQVKEAEESKRNGNGVSMFQGAQDALPKLREDLAGIVTEAEQIYEELQAEKTGNEDKPSQS